MKSLYCLLACLSVSLLTACGGGNYDANKNAPIHPTTPPSDGNNNTGNNNNGNDNSNNGNNTSGTRKAQTITRVIDPPDTFGAGDVLNLDDYFKSDSGLPLTYKLSNYTVGGVCKITGDNNNELQTIIPGQCYIDIRQAGNNEYLPGYLLSGFENIPPKCPVNQIARMHSDGDEFKFDCVPNYLYIYPIKDAAIGTVGQIFQLPLTGEKLYQQGQNLTATLPNCKDIKLDYNGESDRERHLSCTPTQAGDTKLTITNDGKELFSLPITFKAPNPIPPMPITKTGVTRCANATQNDLACDDQAQLGKFYGLDQDGKLQSGIAHDYHSLTSDNGDTCLQDRATGRVWEQKTNDGGLRDSKWQYYWYSTDGGNNEGIIGGRGDSNQGSECGNSLGDAGCNSQAYIAALNKANYCGYSDWRMPNQQELFSLMDYGRTDGTSLFNRLFINVPSPTSKYPNPPIPYLTNKNFFIDFKRHDIINGYYADVLKRTSYIRAVRHDSGLTIPSQRYEIINNGKEIKDNATHLVWQRCGIGQTWNGMTCEGSISNLNWLEGMQQVQALGNGYHLPTIIEIMSLANPSQVPFKVNEDPRLVPNSLPANAQAFYLTNTPAPLLNDGVRIYTYSFVQDGSLTAINPLATSQAPDLNTIKAVRPVTDKD